METIKTRFRFCFGSEHLLFACFSPVLDEPVILDAVDSRLVHAPANEQHGVVKSSRIAIDGIEDASVVELEHLSIQSHRQWTDAHELSRDVRLVLARTLPVDDFEVGNELGRVQLGLA